MSFATIVLVHPLHGVAVVPADEADAYRARGYRDQVSPDEQPAAQEHT